jgi:hypothetical protein
MVEFDEPCDMVIELSAFNSGYRSVAIIGYKFLVNDVKIEFEFYDSIFKDSVKKNSYVLVRPNCDNKLPYSLKEGEITVISINAVQFTRLLKRKKFDGDVEISGYFETAQNKIYRSKAIELNLDDWNMCP